MPALIKTGPVPGLEMTQVPVPRVGPLEVRVKVLATSICGTDLHLYNWTHWAQDRVRHFPLVQGHELCGEVVEIGRDVNSVRKGDFVSAESHIVDYQGRFFQSGLGHIAPETRIIGVDRDGAFAEYVVLPWQNVRPNPPDMPLKVAVLKENFGNAVHVAHAVEVADRDVLITGCGPAGLMTLLVVRARGARKIIVADVSSYRLDFARRLGADVTVDPSRESLSERVRDETGGRGPDVLLELSGAPSAVLGGLDLLRPGGRAVAFGLFAEPLEIDLDELLIFKGVSWHGVVGRRLWETWEQMESLMETGRVDLSDIVTHEFPLHDFGKAFETMVAGRCGKVMMIP